MVIYRTVNVLYLAESHNSVITATGRKLQGHCVKRIKDKSQAYIRPIKENQNKSNDNIFISVVNDVIYLYRAMRLTIDAFIFMCG